MRKLTKNSKNHHNEKEGKTEQEKCATFTKKRKTKQREQSEKWWKKEDEKNEEEDTNQERETRRKKDEKGRYTKEVFKKEAREMQKKNKNEQIFSKREKTFLHTKRFQLKIKAEKSISWRIQDDERNRCADTCVNSGITHADRTAAREQEIQSLKEALKILESRVAMCSAKGQIETCEGATSWIRGVD